MQAEIRIPPIRYQNYPVDMYLRISRQGAQYGLEIHAVGRSLRCPIEITPRDLLELNRQLQQEMYSIARNNNQEPPKREELEALVEVGHYAFKQVFGHSDALTVIKQLTHLNPRLSIQVASEDFFLPWELIYPAPPDKPCCEHFWGMNHLISRVIIQSNCPSAFVSPQIGINICPKLGMLTYHDLDGVEGELHFFQNLQDQGRVQLFLLRSLDQSRKREEFQEFKDFWKNSLDLAYFACHATYDSDFPNQSHILISEEFTITLREMDTYGIAIHGHPLIIMNACETGNLNPLYTSNFAAAFLKYGARGVVATECAVPDAFAAAFAEQLYTRLFAGELLGESLMATRQYFLQEHNNLSGLLYSMYAYPSIQLVQARGSNE